MATIFSMDSLFEADVKYFEKSYPLHILLWTHNWQETNNALVAVFKETRAAAYLFTQVEFVYFSHQSLKKKIKILNINNLYIWYWSIVVYRWWDTYLSFLFSCDVCNFRFFPGFDIRPFFRQVLNISFNSLINLELGFSISANFPSKLCIQTYIAGLCVVKT